MMIQKTLKATFLGLLLSVSSTVFAMTLQDAMEQLGTVKSQGLVGELPNGYLGVVKAGGNAHEVTKLINQARKAQYQKMATSNNIKLSDVEQLAGQKAIQKTESGLFIQVNGKWVKKP